MKRSTAVICSLINKPEYSRKVIPFLKSEYFQNKSEEVIFNIYKNYVDEYDDIPSVDVIDIEIENMNGLTAKEYDGSKKLIDEIRKNRLKKDDEWVYKMTEKWVKSVALEINLSKAVVIFNESQEKGENISKTEIPDLLSDALSISFDKSIGHDYFEDAEDRYEYYHNTDERMPFDIDILNTITNGGVTRKTENILISPSGTGKSLIMCSLASSYIRQGYNVLYISFELAEELIGARIDANLLDIPLSDISNVSKDAFFSKINKVKNESNGRLVIQEYPPKAAHIGHIRTLIKDLKLKKDFVPDVICVDYLNICGAMNVGKNPNSFEYGKTVAEELRRLFVENNVVGWTAVQTNRDGMRSNDIGMDHTSESVGIPFTADLYLAVSSNEELDEIGEYQWKQLKNRYNSISEFNTFRTGVDKSKMRLINTANYNNVGSQNSNINNSDKMNEFHDEKDLYSMEGLF